MILCCVVGLRRKWSSISEELVELSPGIDELEEWFAERADDYRIDSRFSFRQIYLDPTVHGADVEARVDATRRSLASGDIPAGDVTLLPVEMDDAALGEVRRTFGEAFAESLQDPPVDEWFGPVASGYGLHFVRIESMQASRVPEFDEVRDAVERDYLVERTGALKDRFYETLRERYNVVYEDDVSIARAARGGESAQ